MGLLSTKHLSKQHSESQSVPWRIAGGVRGIQFETEIPPDPGSVPDKPCWSNVPNRHGVVVKGEFAKIRVRVVKETVL
jgi:hypothetical protein